MASRLNNEPHLDLNSGPPESEIDQAVRQLEMAAYASNYDHESKEEEKQTLPGLQRRNSNNLMRNDLMELARDSTTSAQIFLERAQAYPSEMDFVADAQGKILDEPVEHSQNLAMDGLNALGSGVRNLGSGISNLRSGKLLRQGGSLVKGLVTGDEEVEDLGPESNFTAVHFFFATCKDISKETIVELHKLNHGVFEKETTHGRIPLHLMFEKSRVFNAPVFCMLRKIDRDCFVRNDLIRRCEILKRN